MKSEFETLFNQLRRNWIGYDLVFKDIANCAYNGAPSIDYPPYNIIKQGEDTFKIEMAVAGISKDCIDIFLEDGTLHVKGNPTETKDDTRTYISKGIAARKFESLFKIGDNMEVVGADMENGLLTISLKRQSKSNRTTIRIGRGFGDKPSPELLQE